jgi:hypothetical protein
MRINELIEVARRADEPDIIEVARALVRDQDRRRPGPPPTRVDARLVCEAARRAQRRERASRPRPPRIRASLKQVRAMGAASAELAARNDAVLFPVALRGQRPRLAAPAPLPARPRQPWRDG